MNESLSREDMIDLSIEIFGIFLFSLSVLSLSRLLSQGTLSFLIPYIGGPEIVEDIRESVGSGLPEDKLYQIFHKSAQYEAIKNGVYTIIYFLSSMYFIRGGGLLKSTIKSLEEQ